MRAISRGVIVFPPDVQGILGAAALLRRLGPDHDLLAVAAHEAARRLYGLSGEPVPRQVHVVDLVPSDSVDTLLVPALHRFAASGARAVWYHGRPEAATVLHALGDTVTLRMSDDGTPTWRLVATEAGDDPFIALCEGIETAEGTAKRPGTTWRMVLLAAASSWDWRRVYTAVTQLTRLAEPTADQRAWAVEQLGAVDRAFAALSEAPVAEMAGLSVAVLDDAALSASVRPELLRGGRSGIDAIACVAGPGRLRLVAATESTDLRCLQDVPGLCELLQEGSPLSGSITSERAELIWAPDDVPAPICALLDLDHFGGAGPLDDGARIHRPLEDRRAKGTDPAWLPVQDHPVIREALGTSNGRTVSATPRGGVRPPAHRTSIEIGVLPPQSPTTRA